MSTSTLPTTTDAAPLAAPAEVNAEMSANSAPLFPTETEIYLLPDGRVVVADLPAELAAALAQVGRVAPCAVPPVDDTPPVQP